MNRIYSVQACKSAHVEASLRVDLESRLALRNEIALKVGEAIAREGLSKTQAAQRLGVSRATLHRVLSGETMPSAELLARIVKQWHLDLRMMGFEFRGEVPPAATAEPSPRSREQVPLPQDRDRVADERSRKMRALWDGFGTLAKDARVKVVAYPLVVVLGAVLVLIGNSAYEKLFGDIYLTVYVNDEAGKPLEGAVVGTSQADGPYVSARTDPMGIASLTIKHGNMGTQPNLGVVLADYRLQSNGPLCPPISRRNERISVRLQRIPNAQTNAQPPAAAKIYRAPNGNSWEMTDDGWVEHVLTHPEVLMRFREVRRDSDYIDLVDQSRVKPGEPDNFFLLRLPVKGGIVQWSWNNPVVWIDLTIVTPEAGSPPQK